MPPKAKDYCNSFSVNERLKKNQRLTSQAIFIKLLYFLSVWINKWNKEKKSQNLGNI